MSNEEKLAVLIDALERIVDFDHGPSHHTAKQALKAIDCSRNDKASDRPGAAASPVEGDSP